MTRIGRANEDDGDYWLGKAERQSGLRRRLARSKVAGEDISRAITIAPRSAARFRSTSKSCRFGPNGA